MGAWVQCWYRVPVSCATDATHRQVTFSELLLGVSVDQSRKLTRCCKSVGHGTGGAFEDTTATNRRSEVCNFGSHDTRQNQLFSFLSGGHFGGLLVGRFSFILQMERQSVVVVLPVGTCT